MARIVPEPTAAAHEVLLSVRRALSDLPAGLVLVACSGGADSLALAGAAADVGRAEARPVGAVIVDHQLQSNSAKVAERAAEQCSQLGLTPVEVRRVVVDSDGGPEAAARDARYRAIERVALEKTAVAVLLAHSLEDQAETVLLGLARGSGVRSLAGMPRRRGILLRPLLAVDRETIRLSCEHWELKPWQDPHNSESCYARVRVRERVLPVLERELGPGVARALARTAELSRDDADALDVWAARCLAEAGAGASIVPSLSIEVLAGVPRAVRTRALRKWLGEAGVPLGRVSAKHVWQAERLVVAWRGQGPVSAPDGFAVRRKCDRLEVGRFVADDRRTGSAGSTFSKSELAEEF